MLVTLVGYDIMSGRSLLRSTSADDYAHFLIACLFHDIGFVRGILREDTGEGYLIDANGGKVKLPRGSSDAALMPYRVDRSKLYVTDRIAKSMFLDAERVARAIEFRRFPTSTDLNDLGNEECSLMRAADFIGQLGDPRYLQKANALYREFADTGVNQKFGCTSAAHLLDLYPQFDFKSLSTHLRSAIRYLNVTSSGRRRIDSNIFRAERRGPCPPGSWASVAGAVQPPGVCTPLALGASAVFEIGTERSDIGFSLLWRPLNAPPIFPLRGGVVGKFGG
jgi:hypothetical protein